MERRRKNTKAKARTPTAKETAQIKNSGYSEGGASRTSSILKSYLPIRSSARSDIDANLPLLRNRSADQAIIANPGRGRQLHGAVTLLNDSLNGYNTYSGQYVPYYNGDKTTQEISLTMYSRFLLAPEWADDWALIKAKG